MRHSTWLQIERSPFWHDLYRHFRRLPDSVRAPLRVLISPDWYLAAYLVRYASRSRVVAGPFRGMKIQLSRLSNRHLLGYFLGTHELELHEVIRRIIDHRYATIVNIGAADGYYAVGFALKSESTRVEAFETISELHPVLEDSATLNGVADRIMLRGACDASGLRASLQRSSAPVLVLTDIEGGEFKLLDPEAVPELREADIFVETHDAFVPHVTDTLIERFRTTHDIERYSSRPRVLDDFPSNFLRSFRRLCPRLVVDLMDERRSGSQHWLFLKAKTADGAADLA